MRTSSIIVSAGRGQFEDASESLHSTLTRSFTAKHNANFEAREMDAWDPSPPPYSRSTPRRSKRGVWSRLTQYFGNFQGKQNMPSWKPITLRAPILGSFVFISLSVIVILEILSHISVRPENGGGLVFARDTNSISAAATFGFLYLPTILAVIYSMMWSWVDLDIKRLEPWFQLSNEGGATAEQSLLLQYPFDFLPFIPFTAFRRKHWGVFFAGFIMIVVFWVITPLQSAIFNTGTVTRLRAASMLTTKTLAPLSQQSTALNANFMNLAYGISWLDQDLPPFTTPEFALLPFQPSQQPEVVFPTETWTTAADAFYTNLTCFPAEVVQEKSFSYTFSNGKGCTVPQVALVDTQGVADYMMSYIGYFSNPQSDWALQNPNCSAEFSNSFLAIWASAASRFDHGVYHNITALFCETSYTSSEMNVAVNASSRAVQWGTPTRLNTTTPEVSDIFNTTNFEYLLGTGVPSNDQQSNLQDRAVLQQFSRIKDYGLIWPVSNMVGFAVAPNTTRIEDLFDPIALQQVFERAHQLLFVAAFNALTSPISSGVPLITPRSSESGVVQHDAGALILVRTISIVVEVALGIIICLTISLWYYSHYRSSHLSFDPASIGDIMRMMPSRIEGSDHINDDGTLTAALLESSLLRKKFSLTRTDSGTPTIVPTPSRPSRDDLSGPAGASSFASHQQEKCDKLFSPVQPVELQSQFGFTFMIVFCIALGAVLFLRSWSSRQNGISIPSESQVVRSIIENYAPTAFATLIEPVWTMLNRLLCLLQPFEQLRKGNAEASESVLAKYTSLPPQLVIWRALKARHFVLAAVCVITVSTNLLAVALSALIEENSTLNVVSFNSSQDLVPKFSGSPIFDPTILSGPSVYFDHFYVALSNITEGTFLPPWIDKQFFYLPFDLKSAPTVQGHDAKLQNFHGTTTGIGTQTSCVEITAVNNTLQFEVNNNGSSIQFSTSHHLSNGTNITCIYPRGASRTANDTTADLMPFLDGFLGFEAVQAMKPRENSSDGGLCASSLIMGWARVSAGTTKHPNGNSSSASPSDREVANTFLRCTQKLLVAEFDVAVDRKGRIVQSNRTRDFATDTSLYFSPSVEVNNSALFSGPVRSEVDLFQESTSFIASFNVKNFNWHNDSFTSDWMNTLLTIVQNSSSLVDPSSPIPNATAIGPLVEGLYQQLFAILLGLNTHVFSPAQEGPAVVAQAVFVESRLFVSPIMFGLTTTLLTLHLLVAIIYYARRPKRFLPRMPTSIASIIAFVSASRAVEDFKERGLGTDGQVEQQYGYGRFVGIDGKIHVGIERQRFVVPLKSRNPEARNRNWGWNFKGRDAKQPQTWI